MKARFKDFFSRDRKTLYMILSIVLISIFSLTIVYAALSVTLNIQGNAEVIASSWDIHLDNVKVTSGSVSGTEPSITGGTTATFSTTLNMPGDFYEFTIDVVNDGSIDTMIDGVSKTPTLTSTQAKYLNYIVEYEKGESINTKQLVKKNDYVRLKVRVEYRKDITALDLPTTTETLNLSFTVNYVQSDGTGSSVTDNGAEKKLINVVSGDGTKTSDEICIGEECFYVISSTDDTVTMLAKYNLYVGNYFSYSKIEDLSSVNNNIKVSKLDYNLSDYKVLHILSEPEPYYSYPFSSPTGKQDSEMKGWASVGLPYKGVSKFSDINYWSSTVSSYPAYVYNENSLLYSYVENYKAYLSTLGVTPSEARLITKEELEGLGCSSLDDSCSSAPSWVYATSYWSGSASSSLRVWRVYGDGRFYYYDYSSDINSGCRPVITISRSLI